MSINKNFLDPEIGDTVRITIPQIDLGNTDARNVLEREMKVILKFFNIGTYGHDGIPKQLYARSQF